MLTLLQEILVDVVMTYSVSGIGLKADLLGGVWHRGFGDMLTLLTNQVRSTDKHPHSGPCTELIADTRMLIAIIDRYRRC